MKTSTTSEKGVYNVVWPRGKKVSRDTCYAKRLDTLEGKTIGELSNRIFRGDEIFPLIEKELASRYQGIQFVNFDMFGSIHGKDEAKVIAALPDTLKQNDCDAVITAVGC